ncbi:MAG: NAD(P)/FAD-dependent oxidoreductase [Phototrophicaceae bacterium]
MKESLSMTAYDAIVIGSGPNGLAAAITLAEAGCRVLVIEARDTIGGGTRTAQLTLPDFHHDICSTSHPLGIASPFFKNHNFEKFGLEWIQPDAPAAHPLEHGDAVIVERDVTKTANSLGADADMYRHLLTAMSNNDDKLLNDFLAPLKIPRYPLHFGLFGAIGILPASTFTNLFFKEDRTRAMFAGMAGHSIQALESPATTAFGMMLLLLAHSVGWGIAKGGSQSITNAMAAYFESLGGEIRTNWQVTSLDELPSAKKILFNTSPRALMTIAEDHLPSLYKKRLANFTYGAGAFKIDYALSEPIPWANPDVARAGTVHLGGTFSEIAYSERLAVEGIHAKKPYILLAQHSLFDDTRAPESKHTCWAYCHAPHGSTRDMTEVIDTQIERYAPGFRDIILKRHTMNTVAFENYNPNYIGGDINAGVQNLAQLFTRPVTRLSPYTTPNKKLYLASSSVPPGGGVHGMGGYWAAKEALKTL